VRVSRCGDARCAPSRLIRRRSRASTSAQSDSLRALAHRQPAQGSLTSGPVEQDVATDFDSGR